MSNKANIEVLRQVIERRHGCQARWVVTGPVKEISPQGKVVWEGNVEGFVLIGHSKARRAFAWSQADVPSSHEDHIVTVLDIPPVDTPLTAVRAFLSGKAKGTPSDGHKAKKSDHDER